MFKTDSKRTLINVAIMQKSKTIFINFNVFIVNSSSFKLK